MAKIILLTVFGAAGLFSVLVLYSCCVISSQCAREEEYRETMRRVENRDARKK